MRYYLVLLFMSLSVLGYGQTAQLLSCKAKSASLQDVFAQMQEDYGITFSYASESIKGKKVSINMSDASLEEILDFLLGDSGMEYKVLDDNVLLRPMDTDLVKESKSIQLKGKVATELDENLAFVTVHILGTDIGTYTDDAGFFNIEIPDTYIDYELQFSFVGYENVRYTIREIKDEILLLKMSTSAYSIADVVIVNKEKPIRLFDTGQAQYLSERMLQGNASGLLGADVSRTLQLLAGVSATDDASADVKIRGGNAEETLIVLDGMPLYHASHYYGIFSAVNAEYLASATLYKNTLPIRYGGKTSGIVELKSQDELPAKATGGLGIDFMTTDGHISVPFSKSVGIELAGRTTLRNISNTQFNTLQPDRNNEFQVGEFDERTKNGVADPEFGFYDLNAKLLWKPDTMSQVAYHYFGSNDHLSNVYDTDLVNGRRANLKLSVNEEEKWESSGQSIILHRQLGDLGLEGRGSYTTFENNAYRKFDVRRKRQSEEQEPISSFGVEEENYINELQAEISITKEVGHNTFVGGVAYQNQDLAYAFVENDKEQLSGKDKTDQQSIYGQYKLDKGPFHFGLGARTTRYSGTNSWYTSPRLSIGYRWADFSLKGSLGKYFQYTREMNYEYLGDATRDLWIAAGEEIPVLSSINAMAGFTYKKDGFTLDVEAYNKSSDGAIQYVSVRPGGPQTRVPREYKLFFGEGRSKGVDATLAYGQENGDSYLTYTLSKVTHSYAELGNGIWLPTIDDRRHQLKWNNQFYLKDWSFSLNTVYATGRPYTDIALVGSNGDIRQNPNRQRRLPAYVRLDIGGSYTLDLGTTKAELGLSIFNLLDNANVKYVQTVVSRVNEQGRDLDSIIGGESSLLGRTINASVRWRF